MKLLSQHLWESLPSLWPSIYFLFQWGNTLIELDLSWLTSGSTSSHCLSNEELKDIAKTGFQMSNLEKLNLSGTKVEDEGVRWRYLVLSKLCWTRTALTHFRLNHDWTWNSLGKVQVYLASSSATNASPCLHCTRFMAMSSLYPCGKPCSTSTHNETIKKLTLFSSVIDGIMIESLFRIWKPVGMLWVLILNRKFYHICRRNITIDDYVKGSVSSSIPCTCRLLLANLCLPPFSWPMKMATTKGNQETTRARNAGWNRPFKDGGEELFT